MKIKWLTFLTFLTILAVAIPSIFSLSRPELVAQPQPEKIPLAYLKALEDTAEVKSDEVLDNLTIIDSKDPVQVVRLTKKDEFSEGQIINPPFISWVTAPSELYDFCRNYQAINPEITTEQLNTRLRQLIGVPNDPKYTHIVTISVDNKYLKRVTYNPDPTKYNKEENWRLIQESSSPENVDSVYQKWFKKQIDQQKNEKKLLEDLKQKHPEDYLKVYQQDVSRRFKTTDNDPYPWTGLGYTYDWGAKTNLQTDGGLSEFVIFLPPNTPLSSPIKVKEIKSTQAYCR
jgi:hypothetical protein